MLRATPGEYTSTVDEIPGKLLRQQDIRSQCAHETFRVLRQKHDERISIETQHSARLLRRDTREGDCQVERNKEHRAYL
jgi:hypothetical protein